jgi:hypothetical protein
VKLGGRSYQCSGRPAVGEGRRSLDPESNTCSRHGLHVYRESDPLIGPPWRGPAARQASRACPADRRVTRELIGGRDDIRVECAGIIAGAWFASPGMAQGHQLIAAGLLLLAGPPDTDLLLRSIYIYRVCAAGGGARV